jgi:adenylate cyclase
MAAYLKKPFRHNPLGARKLLIRVTYTLYGDTVNLAQRLEGLNKELDTDCLICGATYAAAPASCAATAMGAVQVRGREHAVDVYAMSL